MCKYHLSEFQSINEWKLIKIVQIKCDFLLSVNIVNYTNPTGLCAECQTRLNTTNPEGTIRVCCDEPPFNFGNCNNTGEERCDTRFRWTIRQFDAPLETRPGMDYYYTDCAMSPSTCPFSEMSTTFGQGPAAILGVQANPLRVSSTIAWTVRSLSLAIIIPISFINALI